MSKTVKTAEQKKSDKAAYDKARRAAKKTGHADVTTMEKMFKRQTKAEVAADRAAVIAERATLKATAGTHNRPAAKAVIDMSKAELMDQGLVDRALKTPAGKALVKAQKEADGTKEPATREPTVASVAREMVINGQTDEQIFAHLVTVFQVGGEKKYYPSWYRSQLVRKGTIPKAFADAHRHEKKA
jgi:hypothetical protein